MLLLHARYSVNYFTCINPFNVCEDKSPFEVYTIIVPILQVSKLRLRVVKSLSTSYGGSARIQTQAA